MPKMRWRPWLCPGPHWGARDARPDPVVGWGRGHPLPNPHSRAFGAQLLCPNVKSWLRPCDPLTFTRSEKSEILPRFSTQSSVTRSGLRTTVSLETLINGSLKYRWNINHSATAWHCLIVLKYEKLQCVIGPRSRPREYNWERLQGWAASSSNAALIDTFLGFS